MKYLLLGILLLFSAAPSMGQAPDSGGSRQVRKERMVDQDGDGIPDRPAGRGAGMRKGKDRFVDNDGDGICDGRAGGLGLRSRGGRDGQRGGGSKGKGGKQ
jgi:hypothetical protein